MTKIISWHHEAFPKPLSPSLHSIKYIHTILKANILIVKEWLVCLVHFRYPDSQFVVYTGDTNASPEEVFANVKERFNIVLPDPVELVYLHKRKWVEPMYYRFFTLFGQAFGSMYLGLEALMKFVPGKTTTLSPSLCFSATNTISNTYLHCLVKCVKKY